MTSPNINEIEDISYTTLKSSLCTLTGVAEDKDKLLHAAYDITSDWISGRIRGREVDENAFLAVARRIIKEYTIYRFNRVSEEGLTSRQQDGESVTWDTNYLSQFENDLESVIKSAGDGWSVIVMNQQQSTAWKEGHTATPLFYLGTTWIWSDNHAFLGGK